MTLLRAQVDANPRQTIEELLNALNQPWSTIQEHLQQIGKTNRADEKWVLYDNPKRKRQWLCSNTPPRAAKPENSRGHCSQTILNALWKDNKHNRVKIYEVQTVTYGMTSAPYLEQQTLKQLSYDEENKFPAAVPVLQSNFYMYNGLCGAETLEEAKELQHQLTL
ncbi:histone-lysine N-methyltransferase SETMAR [Trichonephila clavipes]|nr:histone-lysine N-methyltransferase SETMAR [Trichonephila clavipes]